MEKLLDAIASKLCIRVDETEYLNGLGCFANAEMPISHYKDVSDEIKSLFKQALLAQLQKESESVETLTGNDALFYCFTRGLTSGQFNQPDNLRKVFSELPGKASNYAFPCDTFFSFRFGKQKDGSLWFKGFGLSDWIVEEYLKLKQ